MPNFGYIKTKESIMDKFIGDHKSSLSFAGAILAVIAAVMMPTTGSLATWFMSPPGTSGLMNQDAVVACWFMAIVCLGMWFDTGGKYWIFRKTDHYDSFGNKWNTLGIFTLGSAFLCTFADNINAPLTAPLPDQSRSMFLAFISIGFILIGIGLLVERFGYDAHDRHTTNGFGTLAT
jgi:hypothetical protein